MISNYLIVSQPTFRNHNFIPDKPGKHTIKSRDKELSIFLQNDYDIY